MESRKTASVRQLSSLLAFIFGGAIVGETAALSMVVSAAGSSVLSRLYLVNGVLLFLLPALFFNNIDRLNRGRLLSWLLGVISLVLATMLVLLRVSSAAGAGVVAKATLAAAYPIAYLSKTVLFVTFWTLANDVFHTGEAKRAFPRIAASGFMGGLCGALLARWLLEMTQVSMVVIVWVGAFLVALGLTYRTTRIYKFRLLRKEHAGQGRHGRGRLLSSVGEVMSIELVRLIAVLYFLVFIAIFSADYLFWHACHAWFTTSRSLASFQFTFYLVHGVATVLALSFVMPALIARQGFVRIFSLLPQTLLVGSLAVAATVMLEVPPKVAFGVVVAFQLARYVAFETSFSPIYQMFFAAVSKEKRGRAKTVLEGVIKPASLMLAGVVVMAAGGRPAVLPVVMVGVSAAMVYVVAKVRTTYMKGLVPDLSAEYEPDEIIKEIGSHYDQKILSLVQEYSHSTDADLRGLAVKILAHLGSRQALRTITELYRNEEDESVKEMIARSLTNFHWYETSGFIEALLQEPNARIRGNAIYSLNGMASSWKWRLKEGVRPLLFDTSMRVRIEAAQYLWQTGDRPERDNVAALLKHLLTSRNANKRSAGLYLVSILKPRGWEALTLDNLHSTSFQVYLKCVETILRSASRETRLAALRTIEGMSRRHVAACGRIAQGVGISLVETITAYLRTARNRRMMFEMVHALRVARDNAGLRGAKVRVDEVTREVLLRWILGELESVYRDAWVWRAVQGRRAPGSARGPGITMLEDALRARLLRICEWALDVLALVERHGVVALGRKDLDLTDPSQRSDMVEIVESVGMRPLGAVIVPILELDSLDALARTGRQHFGFAKERAAAGLEHFIRSGNRWVCLCALYCVSELPRVERDRVVDRSRAALESLAADPYRFLARAAGGLLRTEVDGERMAVDTFRLLETVLFFKKTPLFRNVPAEKLMGLAEICRLVSYRKGTTVSAEADISDQLYIVRSGSLKIVKVKSHVKTILSIVRRGEAYGEIGLFNQAPRSASAVANEDCEVFVVQRAALKKLLLEIPEIAYNFLEVFSEKLRRSGEELALLHTTLSSRIREEHSVAEADH